MKYSNFRRSDDVEDRRNENHHRPMFAKPTGPEFDPDQRLGKSSLGSELGGDDIDDLTAPRGRAQRTSNGDDSGEESGEDVQSYAGGGAIPDDDDAIGSNAGVDDNTTTDLNAALQTVQQALMFGRQKHGLPGGGGSGDNSEPAPKEQSGIPEDGGEESYAEGGVIGDDIEASNNATDDGPQYGRPEVVDDPDAVRPPISSNNTDYAQVPEQTAIPQRGDDSGAMPTTPPINDDSGAGPVANGGAQQQGGIPEEGNAPDMQRILSYLQRKDAMPNGEALAIEKSVAAQAKNDPAAVPVLAAAAAGTPERQFAYVQRNAAIYDITMAHGRAALNGVQGRPPSLDVAVEDATKAFAKVPDGDNVQFVKHGDGVVARVSSAGGTQTQNYALTLQQFDQLLDTGKAGMFDRMVAPGGVRRVLSSFGPSQQEQIQGGLKPFEGRLNDADANRANQTERSVNMGHDVTLLRSPTYDQQNPAEARATQAGRGGSLGLSGKPVRVIGQGGPDGRDERTYIDGVDQTPTAQDNALERIYAKNEGKQQRDYMGEIDAKDKAKRGQIELEQGHKDNRATQGIGSREKIAADKLMESARNREAANGRNAASNAERMAASRVLAGKETPQDKAIVDQIYKASQQQAPRAPQPQQQQAPQPQTPQLTKAQIGEMLRKRGLMQ